jgi:molybdenum cofactor cytidylyltransferase
VNVAGIILAAGESRRMGTPKALLTYRDETFLDRLIGIFEPICSSVTVVLGADPDRIRRGIKRSARWVVNPRWQAGQITSLQTALSALDPCEGVLFTLVDHPAVKPETVASLLAAPGRLRIPRYQGKRGHPVYAGAVLIPEFLAIPPTGSAREVIDRHAAEYVAVDDPGVVLDIDDPEAYRRLVEAL